MKRIATRRNPDVDALGATWLAHRHLLDVKPVEIEYVGRSVKFDRHPDIDCAVSVGCTYDPTRLRFDDRLRASFDRPTTWATPMVWKHLLDKGKPVAHPVELLDIVQNGNEIPAPNAALSGLNTGGGLHAVFVRARTVADDDLASYRVLSDWLDSMEREHRSGLAVCLGWHKIIEQLPPEQNGTCALILNSPAAGAIMVGRTGTLGRITVRHGCDMHIGSAFGAGGVRGRGKHHRTPIVRLKAKGQVDFLRLLAPVQEVWYSTDKSKRECAWTGCIWEIPGADVADPRFSATDCKCPAHLDYFRDMPSLNAFRARVSRLAPRGCRAEHVALEPTDDSPRERTSSEDCKTFLRPVMPLAGASRPLWHLQSARRVV